MMPTLTPRSNPPVRLHLDHTAGEWLLFPDGTLLPLVFGGEYPDPEPPAGSEDDPAPGPDEDPKANREDDDPEDDDNIVLTKEEWDEVQAKQRKANREAAQRRKWLRDAGIDPRTGKPLQRSPASDPDDTPPPAPAATQPKPTPALKDDEEDGTNLEALRASYEDKVRRAEEKAETRAELRFKAPLAREAARAALSDAGWSGKNFDKIMRLVDLDDIDLDEEGNVTGVTEQIDDLRQEFPDWFRGTSRRGPTLRSKTSKPEGKGTTNDVGGTDKKPPAGKGENLNWKQKIAQQAIKGKN
ncbi:hypothetical protein ACFVWN_01030 [Nocardiopsis flavescens]|uniref:phage scaffolding protein n=1 Tax=Nocardiopsis flavescens TaxID=758803 RepID=UPI0036495044